MQINVTVEDIESVDLTTVVGERSRYDRDLEERVSEDVTLGDEVAKRITAKLTKDEEYPGLRKRFLQIRDEEIRAALRPIVDETIAGPLQKTNSYGEPVGETTTLRALIMAETEKLLRTKADSYGRDSETVLGKFVREQIAHAFTKELAAVVADDHRARPAAER
jgi:hypothetical protein